MSETLHFDHRQLAALRASIGAFESQDRARGQQYFRSHAVRRVLPLGDAGSRPGAVGFRAEVEGSELYEVIWEQDESAGWGCSCSCPVEINCKHAYAAALALLDVASTQAPRTEMLGRPPATASSPAGDEAARLVALLEQRHGRALNKAEVSFVKKLERLWQRHRQDGTIYPQELGDVSLADRSAGLYYDPNPAIRGWWDTPLASPLELWQFLAYFAERANRPLPPLMKPLTDTTS